jgi:crotonobetainyl-CoA:carnitine CoA-transferase CaiB-like acyl-CoA transferase
MEPGAVINEAPTVAPPDSRPAEQPAAAPVDTYRSDREKYAHLLATKDEDITDYAQERNRQEAEDSGEITRKEAEEERLPRIKKELAERAKLQAEQRALQGEPEPEVSLKRRDHGH